jgi:hypothetical protein
MYEKKINILLKFKDYYTRNPNYFIEDFFGVKLSPYQKMIVKAMNKFQAVRPVNSGKKLEYYLRALQRLVSLEEDSKVAFYDDDGYKEMTRDEAVEFILRKFNCKF